MGFLMDAKRMEIGVKNTFPTLLFPTWNELETWNLEEVILDMQCPNNINTF